MYGMCIYALEKKQIKKKAARSLTERELVPRVKYKALLQSTLVQSPVSSTHIALHVHPAQEQIK